MTRREPPPRWYKKARVALGLMMGTILLVGLYGFNLWFVYQRTLPRTPILQKGNIYPLNVHGIVVYQTQAERDRLRRWDWWPFGMFVGVGCVFAVLEKLHGEKPEALAKFRERYGRVPDGFR